MKDREQMNGASSHLMAPAKSQSVGKCRAVSICDGRRIIVSIKASDVEQP